jgi:hypothetical protein
MRRFLTACKRPFRRSGRHRGYKERPQPRSVSAEYTDQVSQEVILDLILPEPSPTGFVCWNKIECDLCSQFLDRRFVLELFVTKFVTVGTALDLVRWSQVGQGREKCSLCIYLCTRYFVETDDEVELDASLILRINTLDTAKVEGGETEIPSFEFELAWGFPDQQARKVTMNCFAVEGVYSGFPRGFSLRSTNPRRTRNRFLHYNEAPKS